MDVVGTYSVTQICFSMTPLQFQFMLHKF